MVRRQCSTILTVAVLTIAPLAAVGCVDEQGPFEEAGEEIDEALEDVRDGVEDAAEEVENAVEDVGDGNGNDGDGRER